MRWPACVAASRERSAAEDAYVRSLGHLARSLPAHPSSWWGLCAALSTHYLHQGRVYPVATLWSELVPFLLMENDLVAVVALEEYIVYKARRGVADLAWLGAAVNAALSKVDVVDARLVPLLESPELMLTADWMALLSYSTLLRVRRAALLYDGYPPHPVSPHYWAGASADA
jgi:hypothetical protein